MLPSAGFFKGYSCPFYDSGLCERPYCHFKHVKKDSLILQNDESNSGALQKLVSAVVQKVLQQKEASASAVSSSPPRNDDVSGACKAIPSVQPVTKPTYNPTPISELKKIINEADEQSRREEETAAELRRKHIPVPYTPRKPIGLPVKRPEDSNRSSDSKTFTYLPPPVSYTPSYGETSSRAGSVEGTDSNLQGSKRDLVKYDPIQKKLPGKHENGSNDKKAKRKNRLEYNPVKVSLKSDAPAVKYQPTPKALVPCFSSDEDEPETKKTKHSNNVIDDSNDLDDLGPEFDMLDEILEEENRNEKIITKTESDQAVQSEKETKKGNENKDTKSDEKSPCNHIEETASSKTKIESNEEDLSLSKDSKDRHSKNESNRSKEKLKDRDKKIKKSSHKDTDYKKEQKVGKRKDSQNSDHKKVQIDDKIKDSHNSDHKKKQEDERRDSESEKSQNSDHKKAQIEDKRKDSHNSDHKKKQEDKRRTSESEKSQNSDYKKAQIEDKRKDSHNSDHKKKQEDERRDSESEKSQNSDHKKAQIEDKRKDSHNSDHKKKQEDKRRNSESEKSQNSDYKKAKIEDKRKDSHNSNHKKEQIEEKRKDSHNTDLNSDRTSKKRKDSHSDHYSKKAKTSSKRHSERSPDSKQSEPKISKDTASLSKHKSKHKSKHREKNHKSKEKHKKHKEVPMDDPINIDSDVDRDDDDELAISSGSDEESRVMECKKIFEEYIPTTKQISAPEVDNIAHDNEVAYVPSKIRISRTSDKLINVQPRAPVKPDYKLNAVQAMTDRLAKVKEFHASRNHLPPATNDPIQTSKAEATITTPNYPNNKNSKVRIAHVPYASTLVSAKKTISSTPTEVLPSTSATVIQTVKKGSQRTAHIPNEKFIDRPGVLEPLASKIPANIRSIYLNMMIDECLKIYSFPADAYARAQHEELNTSKKCSKVQIYKNSVVLAVARLRKEIQECKGIKKSGSECSALQSLPQAGKTQSWSIERKNQGFKFSSQDFKGAYFYKNISKWILTEEQLLENGFPMAHPSKEKGRAIIHGQNKKKPPKGNIRNCCRCKQDYTVDKRGFPSVKQDCIYHPNNKYTFRGESKYQCCGQDGMSDGCCCAPCHVWEYVDYENLKGYVTTMSPSKEMDDYGVYALDCEMCYTTHGLDLTRVTVIDSTCKVVYETLVKPIHPIIDYNTRYSGITQEQMDDVRTTLLEVQATLLTMFNSKTILIGHSLESDFKALKLIHGTVIDTSVLFPHKMGPPFKRALRNLSSEYLKKIIQNSVEGHDSAEDATVCMELVIYKLKEDLKTS